ncbi:hypothetical protein Ae168Ps1_2747c [Pseudonocardia sp. Ae168_Ps1]|nr:hypothetical protein Ae150APs1_2739c [Pseudonocardia sp. Ae150A_Ps1]OLL80341.1 hypothetical protein Ae168Ps1_2747c [Pseudonocardia sp. Ae168_Ps1]OLL85532.1 hypothetical protein Ae263Ps1_2587 [Pseudonocardia sp. Ae263_Ps1]OLL94441.1 hypothetical protein Ae356Ps1_4338c [Pseudonocardia sp. Ae356_Ps1]
MQAVFSSACSPSIAAFTDGSRAMISAHPARASSDAT